MKIITCNPVDESVLNEYEHMTESEIQQKLELSENAYRSWNKTEFSLRSELMENAAKILVSKKHELAVLMAKEMGKPYKQGIVEAEKCAWVCKYYADNANDFLSEKIVPTEATKSYVAYCSIGPVLAIMPWNFPFWQVFRFAAPSLMAGNTGILKHSRNTMGCAIEIEKVFKEAGFPEGVFTNLIIGSEPISGIISTNQVKAVTLTGSTPVGQAVASVAGKHLKKSVMELGGSDPYIILEDADIESAAETCVTSRLINSGQSCIAAKRFIVNKKVLNEFEELFTAKMAARIMGDPLDEQVTVGPQARKDLQTDLHLQVESSIRNGAKLLLGGYLPEGKGCFYPPTVLTNVRKGMAAYDEELFGPVGAIIPAEDDNDAIRIANDTDFGLGAAVFTRDSTNGERIAKSEIKAGSCFVNDFVKSDPRLPFGGINQSGYGRELSIYGIKEFVNIKTIVIK